LNPVTELKFHPKKVNSWERLHINEKCIVIEPKVSIYFSLTFVPLLRALLCSSKRMHFICMNFASNGERKWLRGSQHTYLEVCKKIHTKMCVVHANY
jgi:hypothetical protein